MLPGRERRLADEAPPEVTVLAQVTYEDRVPIPAPTEKDPEAVRWEHRPVGTVLRLHRDRACFRAWMARQHQGLPPLVTAPFGQQKQGGLPLLPAAEAPAPCEGRITLFVDACTSTVRVLWPTAWAERKVSRASSWLGNVVRGGVATDVWACKVSALQSLVASLREALLDAGAAAPRVTWGEVKAPTHDPVEAPAPDRLDYEAERERLDELERKRANRSVGAGCAREARIGVETFEQACERLHHETRRY